MFVGHLQCYSYCFRNFLASGRCLRSFFPSSINWVTGLGEWHPEREAEIDERMLGEKGMESFSIFVNGREDSAISLPFVW